ncbi:MAG: N-acetylglucosamine transferase [Limimaricola sp.]|uniref:PepSY domain-containing protein n=1 Tax=Limimaricola sp. TaxID=2211665 RepID=UPI001DCD66C9|nr:PepSY domain-containing protein [Limimaricola sp.]MBI1418276.1 N-acetylglucosamine transferase [Limimaricola sp.]
MLRRLHRYAGLVAAIFVSFLALSGAVLSVVPALNRAATPAVSSTETVAQLAGRVAAAYPSIDQIRRMPSGQIVAYYYDGNTPVASVVDPATGKAVSDYSPQPFVRWMTELHRSLFLGDNGRIATALGAAAMLLLTVSGMTMLARRMGGWRQFFGRARGPGVQRLHIVLGRFAVAGLMLSATTSLYLTAVIFGFVSDGNPMYPPPPPTVDGGTPLPVADLTALQDIRIPQLRELTFPYQGDPTDVFTVTTATGDGSIDQATGQWLNFTDHGLAGRAYEWVYALHTGAGLWWLGLILGAMALTVPVMGVSGAIVWARRQSTRPKIAHNSGASHADTIILVGSEGGATWTFARTLHDALVAGGHKVHTAAMDSLAAQYPVAERMIVMAATYGDGAAPASARGFLKRVNEVAAPTFPVAILAFGDRQFPKFCEYAVEVEDALARAGWRCLMPTRQIDRQSSQDFAAWGTALGQVLGEPLDLVHQPVLPRTQGLQLIERVDYGAEVQAPTAILRFALPHSSLWARLTGRGFPRFAAGDLVGVVPHGSPLPRYYSLASSMRDGILEICVSKHPGGLCSAQLHDLQPGDSIDAFIKANPDFRPRRGRTPVILIAAGTGVGPLAGFIRANTAARDMHLYFGGRDPQSDFLYHRELETWLQDRRLTRLTTAFSRVGERTYVQHRIREDAAALRDLIGQGAQIMVCGGREMAAGVMEALADVLAPVGLAPATLKAQGRYAEDVY